MHSQCYKENASYDSIVKNCIEEGHFTLVILRGVSGSGKSHLALELASHAETFIILSFDEFQSTPNTLVDPSDFMGFQKKLVKKAKNVMMESEIKLIVIDAENIDTTHVKSYTQQAVKAQYEIYVMEPNTPWKNDAQECARLSSRGESVTSISDKLMKLAENRQHTNLEALVGSGTKIRVSNNVPAEIPITPMPKSTTKPIISMNINTITQPTVAPIQKSPNPNQLFSLTPEPKILRTRTCGTNVTPVDIVKYWAEIEEEGTFEAAVESFRSGKKEQVLMKDRGSCCDDEARFEKKPVRSAYYDEKEFERESKNWTTMVEFNWLYSMFPSDDIVSLKHFYDIEGFGGAFKMFEAFGYSVDPNANLQPLPPSYLDDIDFENSCSYIVASTDDFDMAMKFHRQYEEEEQRQREEMLANDEAIARSMAENGQVRYKDRNEPFQLSEKEDIKKLMKLCNLSQERATQLYLDHNRNYSQTYYSLGSAGIPVKMANHVYYPSTSKRQAQTTRNWCSGTSNGEGMVARNNVREMVEELHKKREIVFTKYRCAAPRDKQRYREELAGFWRKIDDTVVASNMDMYNLDLHYMSMLGAVQFTKKAVRRAEESGGRERVMTIITGAGNNSKGNAPRVQPEVVKFLQSAGYNVEFVNNGQIKFKIRR